MNEFINTLTVSSLALVIMVALLSEFYRCDALSQVKGANDRSITATPARALFVVLIFAAFFGGMAAKSYSLAAEPSNTISAEVYECTSGGRGNPACYAEWEVAGEEHSGRIPYKPHEPDEGDVIPVNVSIADPSLVTSQQNLWFVRYTVWALLLVAAALTVLWVRSARRVTAKLREIVQNPEQHQDGPPQEPAQPR